MSHPDEEKIREALRRMEAAMRSNPRLAKLVERARKCPACGSLNFAKNEISGMCYCHNCRLEWPMDGSTNR